MSEERGGTYCSNMIPKSAFLQNRFSLGIANGPTPVEHAGERTPCCHNPWKSRSGYSGSSVDVNVGHGMPSSDPTLISHHLATTLYLTQYAGSSFLDTESDIGEPEEEGSRKRKRKSKFVAKAGDKGRMARFDKILKLNADGRFVKLPKTGKRILSLDDSSGDDDKA
ncbi:hypothetical protein RvY_03848 [Ramazzottius varieornatus]|uniref:Uncharacterized protein n=1 Tax=Ramazzottius varieornatus TaxID=947166 RepID=A0A1D1UT36_RAMVA|nr:hypothetical protein RvY_03848 [Ramazzottius varieornatus]